MSFNNHDSEDPNGKKFGLWPTIQRNDNLRDLENMDDAILGRLLRVFTFANTKEFPQFRSWMDAEGYEIVKK